MDLTLTPKARTLRAPRISRYLVAAFAAAFLIAAPMRSTAAFSPKQTAAPATQGAPAPAASSAVRQLGTVKAVNGTAITLTTDAGAEVTIQVQDITRILRVEPGQKDLKTATPAQLSDVEVSDRLLVVGRLGADGKTLMASNMIVMKHTDVEQTQEQQREDWQKRGIGGLVSAVDPTQGTILITQTAISGAKKTITIQATKDTIIRRYAPQSVNFVDAKVSTIDQIKPGDQVRARGTMGADGASFSAEEIVSGAFRNISGTVSVVDATAGTLTVMDLATKKPVVVHISSDSEVRKLAPMMAQRIAMRLKGGAAAGGDAASAGAASAEAGAPPNANASNGAPASGGGGGYGAGGGRAGGGAGGAAGAAGGGADLQAMLARLPASTLTDFQKGDAVMIVSTEGTAADGVTAITLLGGVEPILEASPSSGSAVLLSPWSLSAPAGADAGGE